MVKNLPANAGDTRDAGSIPRWGRFPGGGSGTPLQCSCLEIPRTEEPGGLWYMGPQSVRHHRATEYPHRMTDKNAHFWMEQRIIISFTSLGCGASYPMKVKVKVAQLGPTLQCYGLLQTKILEWAAFPFSRGSFEPRSPTLEANCLLAEPQGKPKNIGVGSLSLLQLIFPTQELNWGLLHSRQILYQPSYEESPKLPWILGQMILTIQWCWKYL